MSWVKFTEDFRWRPHPGVVTRYRAGERLRVTRSCAEAAVAKGAAVLISNGKRRARHGAGDNDPGAGEASEEARSPSGDREGDDPVEDGRGG